MSPEDDGQAPIPEPELDGIAEVLTVSLGERFVGHPVRVDAGERGRVWVALRDAAGDEEAERVTTERLADRLDELALEERDVEYRIASGTSGEDLVLVCQFFTQT